MLRLGVVQHFTTTNVGKGLFNRLQQVATKSIASADIIRENAACLTKCLATSYLCRTIIFPSKLDFILVVMTIDYNL